MKINWGTGIVIAIVAFMSFILYLVITMSTSTDFDYDLVTEKYYQKELTLEAEINSEKNGSKFKDKIVINRTKEGLKIEFKEGFPLEEITGKVFLYRPSNKQLDFEIPISNSSTYLLVPEKRLVDGRWNIEISWSHKNKTYLVKEKIIY